MARRTRQLDNLKEAIKASDLGTPELHQKGGMQQKLNDVTGYIVARRIQRPIDYYYEHDYIEPYQKTAADLIDKDYHRSLAYSGNTSNIKSSLDIEVGRCILPEEWLQDLHTGKQRYKACMKLLKDTEQKFLHAVVIHDQYLNDIRKKPEFKPEETGMLFSITLNTLRDVLDKVARYYGVRPW